MPIRVLRAITRLNVGGPAKHVLGLNRLLDPARFESLLITGREDSREGRVPPDGVRSIRIDELQRSISPRLDIVAWRRFREVQLSYEPDIVHTHLAKAGAIGRTAVLGRRPITRIHTYHGHVLEGYFPELVNRAFVATERVLARRTDALIAVSRRTRDELLHLGIGTESKWHVIPVGLELDPLRTCSMSRDEARTKLGLPISAAVVGIVGRLVPIKDHMTFLRMATAIAAAVPDAVFVIAGDGELRDALERQATEMLPGRVLFLGWVSDLPTLYRALDVVVLTSRNEGTPVALIEAGAARCPIVSTDVGGVCEVISDGKTGFLAAAGDALGLAQHVTSLLDSPDLRRRIGHYASESMASRFSIDRLTRDISSLYLELLEQRRRSEARTSNRR